MNSTFDLLVLATFFAPMALMVAVNLATYRPSREGQGLLDSPMAIAARTDVNPAADRTDHEELRQAA
jgi:hypothetical protein